MTSPGPGAFILSLDCEGKWGMADRIDGALDGRLTEAKLRDAYRRLLALFGTLKLPASFAFVGAFTLDRRERARFADWFEDVEVGGSNWLHHFRRQGDGAAEGWFLPDALAMTRDAGLHEIASHGFAHLPVGAGVGRAEASREFGRARALAAERAEPPPRTYVYPRNLVAHRGALAAAGFVGHRASRTPTRGDGGRVGVALKEWNVVQRADPHAPADGGAPLPVPAGHFLNWRVGLRERVPMAVTTRRWRSMLEDAARRGRVAHLWLHPHNVIDSPRTLESLAAICRIAADLREKGRIEILTQADYCDRLAQIRSSASR